MFSGHGLEDRVVGIDLPLNFHPTAIRASAVFEPPQVSGPAEAGVLRLLNRPQTLDQRRLEFSGFFQGGGLVAEFISDIGTLLPIAP